MINIIKEKKLFKSFLCVVLSICVSLAVFAPFAKLFVSAEDTPFTKMLYFKTSEPKELMQSVLVSIGETYNFSFGLSASVESFDVVCQTDVRRYNIDASPSLVEKTVKGNTFIYTYSITIPEKTVNKKPVTDKIFVGLLFDGSVEGYLYEPTIYLASDSDKKELFVNRFNGGVLDGWTYDYTWFGEWDGVDVAEWSDDTTTLKIVDYDETLLGGDGGSGGGGDTTPTDKKMYYIKSNGPKELIHLVPVKPGKTYYLTFGMSSSIRRFDAAFMSDEGRSWLDDSCPQIEKISKGGCNIYTYSCTVPEDYQLDKAFFGVKPYGNIEGYIFDIAVYEKDDANKTNILPNADFKDAFNGWSYGWDAWFGIWDDATATEWSSDNALIKIVDYDEELLGLNSGSGEEDNSKKMLHIKSNGPKSLIQRTEVKAGEKYTLTFALSKSIRKFDMISLTDGIRSELDCAVTEVSKEDKGKYIVYTYNYTIPSSYSESMAFFGVQPLGATDGYIFDFSLYKADDASKNELFDNPDFSYALAEWSWGWDAWFGYFTGNDSDATEWTSEDGGTTIKIVNFDENLLGDGDIEESGKKMLYFVNGPTGSQLGLLSKVKAGETYCLEFNMFATGIVNLKVAQNGLRASVDVSPHLDTVEHGNYTSYKYTFKMPDNADGESYFIGPDVTGFVEGFIFDLTLYNANDESKKEIYTNPSFEYGLDDWIWGWNEWFGTFTESGINDWTNGANILKVMNFDLSKIDELIALINVDDGEWWDEKDLISEETEEIATLIGTLTDQNGAPLSQKKLLLVSEERTYEAKTNTKGEFEFKDFIAGFYELYTLDSENNRIPTEYFYTFSHGDEIKLELKCDSSDSLVDIEQNVNQDNSNQNNEPDTEEETEEVAVGDIEGTVYTPELKTVANLKVSIRGVGDTVTGSKGEFSFADVPVGEYEIYTVLEDGKEYVFRTLSVKENVQLSVKLKYDAESKNSSSANEKGFNWIIVIVIGAVVLLAAGAITIIVIDRKKVKK